MNYKELVAEGEKRQLHKDFEDEGSQCPDKTALVAYYREKYGAIDSALKETIKEVNVRRKIEAYVAMRKREKAGETV